MTRTDEEDGPPKRPEQKLRPELALTSPGRSPEGDGVHTRCNTNRSEVQCELPLSGPRKPERRNPMATTRRTRVIKRGPVTVRVTVTTTTAVRRVRRTR